MVYTYTPTYYTSLHDSITSLCKTILPFSLNKRRLPASVAAEQRLSKQQSDNLKWQQDSFHQILNLMGLCKEGILPETEVSAFRSHLLDTLIAAPSDQEQPVILRDKLIFLQELLYAKCISEDEYHLSKRPLLQRLSVQGAEIGARDVIVGAPRDSSEEGWSVIDLKDENNLLSRENSNPKHKSKNGLAAIKQIKGATSVFGFGSTQKTGKSKEQKGVIDPSIEHIRPNSHKTTSYERSAVKSSQENPFWNCHLREKETETRSVLMPESLRLESTKVEKQSGGGDKARRKPFRTLFQREQKEGQGNGVENESNSEERASNSAKKQWGFEGFKKWMKSDPENETTPISLEERSDDEAYTGNLVPNPLGGGPDTRQIKKKLHSNGSPSDFFIDKVVGENIRKELTRIQRELSATNSNVQFSNDHIQAISTRLPVDKADLRKFFPKSWCDRYGDVVLDVVRKEFKDHVGEMGNLRNAAREKHSHNSSYMRAPFEDNENSHPNPLGPQPLKEAHFPINKSGCS